TCASTAPAAASSSRPGCPSTATSTCAAPCSCRPWPPSPTTPTPRPSATASSPTARRRCRPWPPSCASSSPPHGPWSASPHPMTAACSSPSRRVDRQQSVYRRPRRPPPRSAHQRGILEPPDLVAHAGGLLELQVAGVLVHLLLQRLELRHGLGRVERGVVLALLRHAALLAAALLFQ